MRRLWSEPLVDFKGKWHTIPDAGLNPLPVQRPIPIWFGGTAEVALRRLARLGDGWITLSRRAADAKPALAQLDRFIEEAGRTRSQVGLEARISYESGDPKVWETAVREWQAAGATHLSLNTMSSGFKTPQEHIEAIRKFAAAVL
jgi:alkanesulfonate monooxygenase SsuD/methylene tetrahydromethanopterin reductase-like flavin-dependent oxidoreductase (luciferase family)